MAESNCLLPTRPKRRENRVERGRGNDEKDSGKKRVIAHTQHKWKKSKLTGQGATWHARDSTRLKNLRAL